MNNLLAKLSGDTFDRHHILRHLKKKSRKTPSSTKTQRGEQGERGERGELTDRVKEKFRGIIGSWNNQFAVVGASPVLCDNIININATLYYIVSLILTLVAVVKVN